MRQRHRRTLARVNGTAVGGATRSLVVVRPPACPASPLNGTAAKKPQGFPITAARTAANGGICMSANAIWYEKPGQFFFDGQQVRKCDLIDRINAIEDEATAAGKGSDEEL